MIVLQYPGPDLPYDTVPGRHAKMAGRFLVLIDIWLEDVAKILIVPGASQCKSGPGITWLVSVTI